MTLTFEEAQEVDLMMARSEYPTPPLGQDWRLWLTGPDIIEGAMVGVMRHTHAIREALQHKNDADSLPGWQNHIEGALGEKAVAKRLGLYWDNTVGQTGRADVGGYHVRTTQRATNRLWLYRSDPEDGIFILVTGAYGRYTLRGWLRAGDGQRGQYWEQPQQGRPAYYVPNALLKPMDTLPEPNGDNAGP